MRKTLKIAYKAFTVLTLALFASSPTPTFAETPSGCNGGYAQLLSPGNCVLEYVDQATSVGTSGIKINPQLDTCHQYFAGIKLNKSGSDWVGFLALTNVSPNGKLKAGTTAKFKFTFWQDCRSWKDAYQFTFTLVGPSGTEVPGVVTSNAFEYDEKYTGSIDSYCFSEICGQSELEGSFKLPLTASPGAYSIKLAIKSNPSQYGLDLPVLSADYSFSGALAMDESSADISTAGVAIQMVKLGSGTIVCQMGGFNQDVIKAFGLTGTHWKITSNVKGKALVDEFDLPLELGLNPVTGNRDLTIEAFTKNGLKKTLKYGEGQVVYQYHIGNQTKGAIYKCAVSALSATGSGPVAIKTLKSSIKSVNFVRK